MLRVGAGAPVAEKMQVYGYLSPGYSIVSPPQGDSPKGFVIGAHAGGMMDITPSAFVNAELGYQMGFQSVSGADFKTSFFQIGLGAGMHILTSRIEASNHRAAAPVIRPGPAAGHLGSSFSLETGVRSRMYARAQPR